MTLDDDNDDDIRRMTRVTDANSWAGYSLYSREKKIPDTWWEWGTLEGGFFICPMNEKKKKQRERKRKRKKTTTTGKKRVDALRESRTKSQVYVYIYIFHSH